MRETTTKRTAETHLAATQPEDITMHETTSTSESGGPPKPNTQRIMMAQVGGVSGMIHSAVPVVVFVITNSVVGLPFAIGAAIAVAVLSAGIRYARGEPLLQASGGIIGVAAAGAVAGVTGSADGYFLLGIWSNGIEALLVLASVLARRPLTGLVWNLLHGNKYAWRENRKVLGAHDLATLTLVAVLASRFVVQMWLYEDSATGMLATAKIAMGLPLFAVAILVAVWAFRKSTKALVS